MRRMGGCLAFALALLARQARAQTRTDERWPLDSGGSVRIMNPFGSVRVLGWDADSLAVSARLERRAGRFFAAGDVHVRKLGVDTAAGGAGADLEVHVPRGATVWVKAATANIDVEGVDGTLDLSSEGGSIRVLGTPQDVTAETMNGSVELAGGTARARVKTGSGDIPLRGASKDLGATTLSGPIVVPAAGWERGRPGVQAGKFESVTGAIRSEGRGGGGGGGEPRPAACSDRDDRSLQSGVSHRAAGGHGTPVRRRASGADPRRATRAAARDALPGHQQPRSVRG